MYLKSLTIGLLIILYLVSFDVYAQPINLKINSPASCSNAAGNWQAQYINADNGTNIKGTAKVIMTPNDDVTIYITYTGQAETNQNPTILEGHCGNENEYMSQFMVKANNGIRFIGIDYGSSIDFSNGPIVSQELSLTH